MLKKAAGFPAIALLAIIMLLSACASNSSNNNETSANTSGSSGQQENQPAEQPADQPAAKAGGEVNVYSARHYAVDAELYAMFTELTGTKVNVIEGNAAELIERITREGASTPADLFITVDGGILNNAKIAELLQPIHSDVIDAQVPANLRDKDSHWVGLSTRARVIVYAKDRVDPSQITTYEDLASDKWSKKLLTRSSTHLYNQSLLASLISLNGEQAAEAWAAGVATNLARDPEGGDRDQAKAIVAGVGDVAIMNSYYIGQMSVSDNEEEVKVANSIGVIFPNQATTGTHVNISGAGLIKHSKNKDNALRLIEFLTAPEAQSKFSNTNFEFPVNATAELPELLKSWGTFNKQHIDFAVLGENNPKAVEIMNKVGWK